jgi:hypothetical protein
MRSVLGVGAIPRRSRLRRLDARPGEDGRGGEIVSPRCILLTELAARIGWEREHGYRWRAGPPLSSADRQASAGTPPHASDMTAVTHPRLDEDAERDHGL